MISEKSIKTVNLIKQSNLFEYRNLYSLYQVVLNIFTESYESLEESIQAEDKTDLKYLLNITKFIRAQAIYCLTDTGNREFEELYWKATLFEAPHRFESYLLYTEKDRTPKKKFYQPRRKTLKCVVDDLQDLEEGIIKFYGLSLPPRVGKSTVCIFFLSWIMGRRPNSHNAMGGHSGILADGFYSEAMKLIITEEYKFIEIFPYVKFESKSADKKEINLNTPDRFATLTCRGIEGTWTGAVDISEDGYLYVDDLIRDRTESLSPIRLENRYQDYLNVMVDRKNDGARELMVGTRWNLFDPLGKIESENKGNPQYRFRKIPALNDNGESNFQYEYKGFSTKYFLDIKERLDKNEWEAKYQQRPFVREGLLFPEDELKTYKGILPDGPIKRKVAVCDVAWGGGDSLSMPFGYECEDGLVYIPDWIFNKGDKTVTKPIVVGRTLQHKPHQEHFEANNGGDEYADSIEKELIKSGFKTNVTYAKASNQVSKLAKIVQYAPDIKKNFRFIEPKLQSEEYSKAFDELITFVQTGKNEHDDSPDSLAQLASFLLNGFAAVAEPCPRIF